ncbi:sulfotransferase family protein [Leisingera sp. ANG-M6]|uniref:sulfotransferase family protein n=1 Tax=Leisingera sp. ANG-M6 TaxID=1577900 RepID=UPI0009E4B717|nr:sulfotransferase [Leisingera sp. ANG-M6]
MTTHRAMPIFVLGLQRSGTTLAANLLAAQPGVAAVAAERHHGVHESIFFSHFAPAMEPWPSAGWRADAAGDFLRSEYYQLCGLSRRWGEQAAEASASPAELFCGVMEALSQRQNAMAWVEKSPHHTLLGPDIAKAVPRALFLCVSRGNPGFLRSRLWSYGRRPPSYPWRALLIGRACASNVFHQRCMRQLQRQLGSKRVFLADYETLRADPGKVLAPVLAAAGLEADSIRPPEYAPNSSFASRDQRKQALTAADLAVAKAAQLIAYGVPQTLLAAAQRRRASRRPADFPVWVWPATVNGPPRDAWSRDPAE